MPAIHRHGPDICSGHQCWPPRGNAQGSENTFCNSAPIHRQGDGWQIHCCPPLIGCHGGVLSSGASRAYINGKQMARIGDPVSCGSTCGTGSGNSFEGS